MIESRACSTLASAFEQRVIQPASIHGYYGYHDHKHTADAHSWSSPTAFAATLAQHTALRPVSKAETHFSPGRRSSQPLRSTAPPRLTRASTQTVPTHRELCGIWFRLTGIIHWLGKHHKMYGRLNLLSTSGLGGGVM
ncbi:unnamed protein product [Euphydryas editha]|uniref:Uncharacterized protein n=1 Tax=Euphydryas editha TaxID=104508 RepID=A0AAU9TNI2_EUPED|nr:unnamed protein product [Euphydryas editha]